MTDFAVTGKKRSGKGLFCAGLIRDAIRQGKPVATNMDIFIEHMVSPSNRATIYRLPDFPSVADLEAIGSGNEEIDDDKNGIIVLDEASALFNARSWNDKGRQDVLNWLIHSGKLGWDVYYQMQGLSQIDKQIRDTQIEYHIPVKRTDKWPIPVITPLAKLVGLNIRFPRMHVGVVKHGVDRDSLVIERKWYRADDLRPCYDTRQKLMDSSQPQAVGLHTLLSAYHLKGRYLGWWKMNKHILISGVTMGLAIGVAIGGLAGFQIAKPKLEIPSQVQIDDTVKAVGLIHEQNRILVQLSDGKLLPADKLKFEGNTTIYQVAGKWVKL